MGGWITEKPNEYVDGLVVEHRSWLSSFDGQYLRNWEKLLKADDEAALSEAVVRRELERWGVAVEPNEELTGAEQRPDFHCRKEDFCFNVEVTCISIEKATAETGLVEGRRGASSYEPLNDAVFNACKGKARQCGDCEDPTLVAVVTFHSTASMICLSRPHVNMLLTGETKIAWDINVEIGQAVGDPYQITELRSATFLRPDPANEVGYARSSVSGLLLVGAGVAPPRAVGVLHPNPVRRFEHAALPDVPFCELVIDRSAGKLSTAWIGPAND